MSLKKAALIVALCLVTVFCFFRVYKVYWFVQLNPVERPNILVVSVCSMRANMLSLYGAVRKNQAPALEKFFAESHFVFQNAFNGMGWTNISNYTQANLTSGSFFFSLYENTGHDSRDQVYRVPTRRSVRRLGYFVNDSDFEKDHVATTKYVEEELRKPRFKPFFAVVHYKYLHYPLIDRFNSDAHWDRHLDKEERDLVVEYLAHPEKYYQKLSFLLFLANNPYHVLAHPKYKDKKQATDPASLKKLLGLMTNPDHLQEWKASAGYERDLQILEKIYTANMNYLDQLLEPLLNLWGDEKLRQNTVVVFAADHGETHMERGELTHGMSLWDPMLRVPLAVRFPDSGRQRVVKEQIDHVTVSHLLYDVITGARSPAAFEKALEKRLPEVIIARNCNNDLRGLRFKNKYKYFVRLRDGERFLFDLENDPGELKNIAPESPEEVARMEGLYWQNLGSITNVASNACPPTLAQ